MASEFEFNALAYAENYRREILRLFLLYLKGDIAEVGAGVGHFTKLLVGLEKVRAVYCVEPDGQFCSELRKNYPGCKVYEGFFNDNINPEGFDAILSTNVLEHIENDLEELKKYRNALVKKKGILCLFVPARMELYSPIDRDFGHYRRYDRKRLGEILRKAGFEIQTLKYFNFLGYFIWLVNFRMMKSRQFKPCYVRLFDNKIFPVSNKVEKLLSLSFVGQSLYAVASPSI